MAEDTSPAGLSWLSILDKGGVVAVLVLILWSGFQGWWVWGSIHQEAKVEVQAARKERDEYRDLVLKMVHATDDPSLIGMPPPTLEIRDAVRRLDEKISR